ncbi:MAG: protease inhibitor I42 family protein, partial [Micromonosporaceae bacterium]|nr:protease inhibitor I42 family protein [Micromonosporaceae bacterium]
GTVTASFSADRAGAATVVATRTSCGEARGCSPDQARYAVVVIVGNGDPSPAVVTAVSSPATAGPSVATAAPPPGPSSSSTVVATDADNGGSVTLATGELLTVRLASTYWHFAATGPGVLQQQGAPRVDARPPGIACVPGGGCGTVTATFRAVAPGRVQLTATRTSCGEARGCTGNQGVFRLTVVVG